VGLDAACCSHHLAAATDLADERRSASAHVLNAADENAQKNPNRKLGKQTDEKVLRLLPAAQQIRTVL